MTLRRFSSNDLEAFFSGDLLLKISEFSFKFPSSKRDGKTIRQNLFKKPFRQVKKALFELKVTDRQTARWKNHFEEEK
jgi:hypothetical protein